MRLYRTPALYSAPASVPFKPKLKQSPLSTSDDWRPWVMTRLREVAARQTGRRCVRSFRDPSVDLTVKKQQ